MKNKTPFKFSKEEIKIISANFKSHTDWETKKILDPIKEKIKKKLRPKQGNKCFYCKNDLGFDIKSVEIDHIISKADYEFFAFEPKNLTLTCPGCNNKKGQKKVLNKVIKRYPTSSKAFIIVHAHLDTYNKHIIIHDNSIYEGVTVKGCRTIEICELFRLKTIEKRKRQRLLSKNKSINLVDLVQSAPSSEIEKVLKEIMKRIK